LLSIIFVFTKAESFKEQMDLAFVVNEEFVALSFSPD
jgi:hypothetical protein